MGALVLAVLDGSVKSDPVRVAVPAVFSVTLEVRVPATKAELAGSTALVSEELIATVSVALVITFQFASTAFTVTLNGFAAVCTLGLPVLPVPLPPAPLPPRANI